MRTQKILLNEFVSGAQTITWACPVTPSSSTPFTAPSTAMAAEQAEPVMYLAPNIHSTSHQILLVLTAV